MKQAISKDWEDVIFEPTGRPYDYSPKSHIQLEELAEEVSRITGIDGLTSLKVMVCECSITNQWHLERAGRNEMVESVSFLTGFPKEEVRRVLDGESDIIWRIGTGRSA